MLELILWSVFQILCVYIVICVVLSIMAVDLLLDWYLSGFKVDKVCFWIVGWPLWLLHYFQRDSDNSETH